MSAYTWQYIYIDRQEHIMFDGLWWIWQFPENVFFFKSKVLKKKKTKHHPTDKWKEE